MKRLGISKQILVIAILPALIVTTILTTYYLLNQLDYISESLNKNGEMIAKELSPAAEYAVYSGNIEFIDSLISTIMQNNPVLRVQIFDKYNNSILDVTPKNGTAINGNSKTDLAPYSDQQLIFKEAIISKPMEIEDNDAGLRDGSNNIKEEKMGEVIVTLTNKYANEEKVTQIEKMLLVTLAILLITTLLILRINKLITRPIISLTTTVRNITAGDLDTKIELSSTGELGILESCINQMKNELKSSQTDMEKQLDIFTDELQQTLEELEIRNAELDITRSKAIHANNAKSEFLANMSHEIRTPLSGIIGFTELLQGTYLTSQQKDYSTTIQKSAKSLLEIINDILDLSKIESGKTDITKSAFNLIDIIEDIITLLTPAALEKNIELFYRIDRNIAKTVNSDPFRIHQILTNLIGNAIKFTESGYVYLQVTEGEIKKSDNSIKCTVSDTGIGLSNTDKNKLFKAFTQADTSITRRFGGTGLGLVISRKLALLMEGEIGFDSTEGEGSTFWFSIPVIPIYEEQKNSKLANKKIALISDNFIAKQAFKTLFESFQCQVTNYIREDLNQIKNIEELNDIIAVFISRKEINSDIVPHQISKLEFSRPSLLIASTQSHTELRNIQKHNFDSAIFTSEKIERIERKLINLIEKSLPEKDDEDVVSISNTFHDWSDINIMVVDDNEVNLRLAEIILHKHRARVTTARSGIQALDYASMNSYDIIFMDLHMPGLDGYEATKRIREISPGKQSVIIALTANAMPNEKDKIIQCGMNGYLIKPVSNAILQKVIDQWIFKKPISVTNQIDEAKDRKTDSTAIFSLAAAKEFTGGNEDLAYELFNMLCSELDDYTKVISTAISENDLIKLHHHVHKLHGSSRCCGTAALKEVSSHIENLINQNINFDINKECALLLAAIKNVQNFNIENNIG